jgi:enamine deaminase RidA (YjgF/YER057c/UK114 family)
MKICKKTANIFACSLLSLFVLQTNAAIAAEGIDRQGEGRILYSTIKIPANAETLYVSGAGASPLADGSWGNMEQQAIDIFAKFKATLEEQGWKMSDIVQVRVFGIAGEDGVLDFEGFNKGYLMFFGTEENPTKPVRTFVQVADLVREGWLVEVEIRAARVPE